MVSQELLALFNSVPEDRVIDLVLDHKYRFTAALGRIVYELSKVEHYRRKNLFTAEALSL